MSCPATSYVCLPEVKLPFSGGQAFPSPLLRASNDVVDVSIRGGWFELFGAEEGVAEEEEDAEDPDEWADFAVAASADFDEGEGEEAEAEARSDAEGEWRCHHGDEGRQGFAEILPVNVLDGLGHQDAHKDQGRRCRVRRDCRCQWSAKRGQEK